MLCIVIVIFSGWPGELIVQQQPGVVTQSVGKKPAQQTAPLLSQQVSRKCALLQFDNSYKQYYSIIFNSFQTVLQFDGDIPQKCSTPDLTWESRVFDNVMVNVSNMPQPACIVVYAKFCKVTQQKCSLIRLDNLFQSSTGHFWCDGHQQSTWHYWDSILFVVKTVNKYKEKKTRKLFHIMYSIYLY